MMGQALMHAIEHITIKGFKSIASIEKLELRPVNVVIGANGSGKSNLLEALAFLREIADGRLRSYVARAGGAEKVLHFGSKVTREMELRLFYGPGAPVQSYDLTLVASDDDGLVPTKEVVVKYGGHDLHISPGEAGREAGISQEEDRTHREYIRRVLWNLRLYHLNDTSSSSPILKTGSVDDNRFLRADGSNLAPLLYTLRALAQHSYRAIVKEVRRVAPLLPGLHP